ncbi:hypothetical protein PFISCL1PPCAC_1403, partial [Pristionchus fissidentatus]
YLYKSSPVLVQVVSTIRVLSIVRCSIRSELSVASCIVDRAMIGLTRSTVGSVSRCSRCCGPTHIFVISSCIENVEKSWITLQAKRLYVLSEFSLVAPLDQSYIYGSERRPPR